MAPADAVRRYGREALFFVTIWRTEGGHSFVETKARLMSLGCRRVESFIPCCGRSPAIRCRT